jgi:hypothetical protein
VGLALADDAQGELVVRVELQIINIDHATDLDGFGVDHNAAEIVGLDTEVFVDL